MHSTECIVVVFYIIQPCSGSVVECLIQDGGAAGSSLTDVTALCP